MGVRLHQVNFLLQMQHELVQASSWFTRFLGGLISGLLWNSNRGRLASAFPEHRSQSYVMRLNLTTQGMALPALVFLVTALAVTLESLQAELPATSTSSPRPTL